MLLVKEVFIVFFLVVVLVVVLAVIVVSLSSSSSSSPLSSSLSVVAVVVVVVAVISSLSLWAAQLQQGHRQQQQHNITIVFNMLVLCAKRSGCDTEQTFQKLCFRTAFLCTGNTFRCFAKFQIGPVFFAVVVLKMVRRSNDEGSSDRHAAHHNAWCSSDRHASHQDSWCSSDRHASHQESWCSSWRHAAHQDSWCSSDRHAAHQDSRLRMLIVIGLVSIYLVLFVLQVAHKASTRARQRCRSAETRSRRPHVQPLHTRHQSVLIATFWSPRCTPRFMWFWSSRCTPRLVMRFWSSRRTPTFMMYNPNEHLLFTMNHGVHSQPVSEIARYCPYADIWKCM